MWHFVTDILYNLLSKILPHLEGVIWQCILFTTHFTLSMTTEHRTAPSDFKELWFKQMLYCPHYSSYLITSIAVAMEIYHSQNNRQSHITLKTITIYCCINFPSFLPAALFPVCTHVHISTNLGGNTSNKMSSATMYVLQCNSKNTFLLNRLE